MEEAGGKCLPCVVDVREEAQIQSAMDQAVQKFGGIDILVNNVPFNSHRHCGYTHEE